jgi:stage II sporulation protein AA (anti-sigma F factor antagonist)
MPDDVEGPVPVDPLRVEAGYVGSHVTITLEGEFDLSGTELFWAYASEALDSGPESIVVDAAGLTFIDSAGLVALWRARDAAYAAGVAYRVSNATPAVRRVVELLGLEALLSDD